MTRPIQGFPKRTINGPALFIKNINQPWPYKFTTSTFEIPCANASSVSLQLAWAFVPPERLYVEVFGSLPQTEDSWVQLLIFEAGSNTYFGGSYPSSDGSSSCRGLLVLDDLYGVARIRVCLTHASSSSTTEPATVEGWYALQQGYDTATSDRTSLGSFEDAINGTQSVPETPQKLIKPMRTRRPASSKPRLPKSDIDLERVALVLKGNK